MAYMQHDCFGAIDGSPTSTACRQVAPVLTALERQVVALAAREPLSSLATARRPIARALFGVEPARALADPRLEALRRFVVQFRHGHRSAPGSGEALVDMGFAPGLLADLRATIAVARPSAVPAIVGLAAMVTLVAAIVALVASYVDELLPAMVIGLAICLPLVTGIHGIAAPASRLGQRRRG